MIFHPVVTTCARFDLTCIVNNLLPSDLEAGISMLSLFRNVLDAINPHLYNSPATKYSPAIPASTFESYSGFLKVISLKIDEFNLHFFDQFQPVSKSKEKYHRPYPCSHESELTLFSCYSDYNRFDANLCFFWKWTHVAQVFWLGATVINSLFSKIEVVFQQIAIIWNCLAMILKFFNV